MFARKVLGVAIGALLGIVVSIPVTVVSAAGLAILQLYLDGHRLGDQFPLGHEWVTNEALEVHLSGYDLILLAIVVTVWVTITVVVSRWWWTRPARRHVT